jgi:hypothetical protein
MTDMTYTVSHTVQNGIERIVYSPEVKRFETPILMQQPDDGARLPPDGGDDPGLAHRARNWIKHAECATVTSSHGKSRSVM